MNQLLERLEQEIFHLETINAHKSVAIKVGPVEFPMYFDVEMLLREKKEELNETHKFLEEIKILNEELSGLEKQMIHLNGPHQEEEVILYHVGVPFKFSRQELIDKLEKRKKIAQKHLSELNNYVETGEQTY